MTRRVVVTGIGLVCAVGIGTDESWKNLLAGQGGIATITSFDTAGFDCRIAGQVKNFDPFQWIGKKELKKMGRFIQLALAGADFAVKMADWKPEQSDLDEVGVYVSSGIGGFDSFRTHFDSIWGARAEFGDGDGVLGFRACDRRFVQDYRARCGGDDDLRRDRSGYHADGDWGICVDEGAFDAE